MRRSFLALLVLLAVAWLLHSVVNDAPEIPESHVPAGPIGFPTLAGTADRDERQALAPAATDKDERQWTLEVVFTQARGYRGARVRLADLMAAELEEAPDSSFAGVRIRVERHRGGRVEPLATGHLDRHGRARFNLPTLAGLDALDRVSSRLAVVPLGEGVHLAPPPRFVPGRKYPYGVRTLHLPGHLPEGDVTMLLQVEAHIGGTVIGRAELSDGSPAASASVTVVGRGDASAMDTCTDEGGRFALHVRKGGSFDITVRARNGTRADRREVVLAAGRDVDLGTFALRGKHRYAGRVTYPDGAPATGVRIEADTIVLRAPEERGPLPCGAHDYEAHTWTDAEGRFELYMPQLDRKREGTAGAGGSLWARVVGVASVKLGNNPHGWLLARPHADYRAVVHGHEVRVAVQDAEGLPVKNARVQFWEPTETPLPAHDDKRKPATEILTKADGRASIWLRPGTRWRVVTTLPGAVPNDAQFTVPGRGNASDLAIVLEPLDTEAFLGFRLEDPAGNELLPAVLTIRTEIGSSLFSRRVDEPGFVFPLAGGRRYDVEAWSIEDPVWSKAPGVGYSFTQRWRRARARVEVPLRGTHVAVLKTTEAAHLQVVTTRAPDLAADDLPWSINIELEYESTGRLIEPSSLSRPADGPRRTVLSNNLEAGVWLVRLVQRGLKRVTRRIDLESGRLGRVDFLLEKE